MIEIEQDLKLSIIELDKYSCGDIFNNILKELLEYMKKELNKYNDDLIRDTVNKTNIYEKLLDTLINKNFYLPIDIYFNNVYINHIDHINDVINRKYVDKQDILYFNNIDLENEIEKNSQYMNKDSLIHLLQFKNIIDKIDIGMFNKVYYYLGILNILVERYCILSINYN